MITLKTCLSCRLRKLISNNVTIFVKNKTVQVHLYTQGKERLRDMLVHEKTNNRHLFWEAEQKMIFLTYLSSFTKFTMKILFHSIF